ncbi:DNA polymerase III subunit delta [Candidatus Gracilibacteria bacterium]|nr:DNA polymerase III subunit delta [Candidatus Gracilibacteria bacterium]
MLYLFTGNSRYLIEHQVSEWKKQFIQKHGDFNLLHLKNIIDYETNFIIESLTALPFGGEKKLVCIDIESENKKENYSKKLDTILSQIDHIPENNIVLIVYPEPDKRAKFFKDISKVAQKKEFNISETGELQHIIEKKYNDKISYGAIQAIMRYKGNHLEKIVSEIDKLLITYERIEEEYIYSHILPELEENIFQCIDLILSKQTPQAIEKIHTILEQTSIYAFYNNLLANLRPIIYIQSLKKTGVSQKQIADTLKLGNRAFLINKSYKLPVGNMKKLYTQLIDIDTQMKTGKLLGSEEKDITLAVEYALLSS